MDSLSTALEAGAATADPASADELADRLERVIPGALAPSIRAQTVRYRARRAAASGRAEEAEAGFKQSTGAFRELQLPFQMAITLADHGKLLASLGRSEEAEPLLTEAREVFEQLGATPRLEGVQRVSVAGAPVAAS